MEILQNLIYCESNKYNKFVPKMFRDKNEMDLAKSRALGKMEWILNKNDLGVDSLTNWYEDLIVAKAPNKEVAKKNVETAVIDFTNACLSYKS